MPAYLIVYAKVHDAARFATYVAAVQPVIAAHGGRLMARAAPPEVLESEWPYETAGLLEFPSMEAAQGFWHSPEYVEVMKLRVGAADFQVVLAPGI
jgi:uncharacterized protein (DUF1330 family)